MNNLFTLLLLVSLFGFFLGTISPKTMQKVTKKNISRGKIAAIFGTLFTVSFFGFGATAEPSSDADTLVASDTQVTTDLIAKIENSVKSVDDFEVTVWTENGSFANANDAGLFEVIVNSTNDQITDCFDAKSNLHDVMQALYSDPSIAAKVSRVKFTAWGELKASIGADDGKKIDWNASGPSLLWSTLLQYGSQEDENGALTARTWGEQINAECR